MFHAQIRQRRSPLRNPCVSSPDCGCWLAAGWQAAIQAQMLHTPAIAEATTLTAATAGSEPSKASEASGGEPSKDATATGDMASKGASAEELQLPCTWEAGDRN